jgi:hypothetical protein
MGSVTSAARPAQQRRSQERVSELGQPLVRARGKRGVAQLMAVWGVLAAVCQMAWLAAICWVVIDLIG